MRNTTQFANISNYSTDYNVKDHFKNLDTISMTYIFKSSQDKLK